MIGGILFGLAAACSQSASYVFTRLYVVRRRGTVLRLLALSHVLMGVASVAALPFVIPPRMPAPAQFALPLVGAAAFYLVGQTGLFCLVRHVEASRAAPLLGVKIIVLALIAVLALDRSLASTQWAAVALCAAAALTLNASGTRLSWRAAGWLLLACVAYSLSDLCIERLVHSLQPAEGVHASVLGVAMVYTICGALGLAVLPAAGGVRPLPDWTYALPFAFFWLLAMAFLFACFEAIGAVFGNILQSTRGIISVAIGAGLARAGLHDLEERVGRAVMLRRVLAALMMSGAIWLYLKGRL